MFRLSAAIGKAEDRIIKRFGKQLSRTKGKLAFYIPTALIALYFYGMVINSIALGIEATFGTEPVESIWVFHPFRNIFAIFTGTGLVITAVSVLLFCLITKKGYIFFSGYKFIRDERGFDILPDGTHGTAKFMTPKEASAFLEVGKLADGIGTILGKHKDKPDDDDKYAEYISHMEVQGLNNNILVVGAPGSYKTRGFVIPFALRCCARKESLILTDPKGELFSMLSRHFLDSGYYVKACNFLDMAHSDGWNCFHGLDEEPQLVQTVANTIIKNTSGPKEADDFWSRSELNLLMALIHYVVNLRDDRTGELLPMEQRSLGDVYRMLAEQSINQINSALSALPHGHPAKGPHGLFLKAKENLWGNIATGLGNRLAVYQNQLVDTITRNHDIDMLLPGQKPCVYFVIISAQDSAYRFLSSLFFSLMFPRLSDYARLHGVRGRLPVTVNFCLDEYCNIGYLDNMSEVLASVRGFNMNVQIIAQSISQYQHRYQGKEWETQLGSIDTKIYLGCNEITSAKLFSELIGSSTITVTNNQMPLMPLFSPIYGSTRPYSQTRSNTQRALMLPDEVLRLDNGRCIVLIRGKNAMLLYKVFPEELPGFEALKETRIVDYIPRWRREGTSQKQPTRPSMPQTAHVTAAPKPVRAKKAAAGGSIKDDLEQLNIPDYTQLELVPEEAATGYGALKEKKRTEIDPKNIAAFAANR